MKLPPPGPRKPHRRKEPVPGQDEPPVPGVKKRGRPPAPGESFEGARRRKEIALADLRELEVSTRRAVLLDAAAVSRTWCDMMRRIQAGVLAVSSRLRQQLPHLTGHDVQVIDRELRDALSGLADAAEHAAGADVARVA